jgi:predicted Rossmann-fold nucleotide-binding protein
MLMDWNTMAQAATEIQSASEKQTQAYALFRRSTSLMFRVACWGSVSSIMTEKNKEYQSVKNFSKTLAQKGIVIVAGGPYMEQGCGVGVQHAAHQGAFEISPEHSIGIDLYIPEWGTGASGRIYHNSVSPEKNDSNPVGFYIQAETLEDRMKYMEILAQVFIAFPVFGFGTDLERARMAQILYFLHTLKEQIPESIFPGSRAFREFGLFPKLLLIGPYNYCRSLADEIANTDESRAWVRDENNGIFVFRSTMEEGKVFIEEERQRWRDEILAAGGAPQN